MEEYRTDKYDVGGLDSIDPGIVETDFQSGLEYVTLLGDVQEPEVPYLSPINERTYSTKKDSLYVARIATQNSAELRTYSEFKYNENSSVNTQLSTKRTSNREMQDTFVGEDYFRPDSLGNANRPVTLDPESTMLYRSFIENYNGLVAAAAARQAVTERKAHSYRAGKLGFPAIRQFLADRVTSGDAEDRRRGLNARLSDEIVAQDKSESHRNFMPLLADCLSNPEERAGLMSAVDLASVTKSDELKLEAETVGIIKCDVFVLGTGVQSAVFSSELRGLNPDARIICADRQPQLGGQFRQYGKRPVFKINSRAHRQESQVTALPGRDGNLNTMGKRAVIQVTDFANDTYPSNVEVGDAAAINGFMSAESMLETEVTSFNKNETGDDWTVTLKDLSTGSVYKVVAKDVVAPIGLGSRESRFGSDERIMTAETLFKIFGDNKNSFPMEQFRNKRIAIIGGGDTGRVVAELFTRLAPKEAYGRSSVQLGSPKSIDWFGVNFMNRSQFCAADTRPRYQQLASFIYKDELFNRSAGGLTIIPKTAKVTRVDKFYDDKLAVITGDMTRSDQLYDYVIDATNLSNNKFLKGLEEQFGKPRTTTRPQSSLSEFLEIAKEYADHLFVTGPGAALNLSQDEKSTFNSGIKENTAAIWANTPRSVQLARLIYSARKTEVT